MSRGVVILMGTRHVKELTEELLNRGRGVPVLPMGPTGRREKGKTEPRSEEEILHYVWSASSAPRDDRAPGGHATRVGKGSARAKTKEGKKGFRPKGHI